MKNRNIYANFLYKVGLLGFNSIFPLLIIPYVYRVLNPNSIGLIEYGLSINNYFVVFGALGIYTYGLREISKVRDNKKEVERIFSNLFVIGIISNLIFLFIYFAYVFLFISSGSRLSDILIILGLKIVSGIFYIEWYFEANENFRFITIKTIIVRGFQFILILSCVNNLSDYLIYVLLIAGTIFINNLVSFIAVFQKISLNFRALNLRKYIKPLFIVFLLNNSSLLYTQTDVIFLGSFSGNSSVAYYTVAKKLVVFLFTIIMAMAYVAMPRLSYFINTEYDKYIKGIKKLSQNLFFIILPSSIGLFLFSHEAIRIYAGNQYIESSIVLKIFALRMIFMTLENLYSSQILFLNNKELFVSKIFIVIGLINLFVKAILNTKLTPVIAISTTFFLEIIALLIFRTYINKNIARGITVFSKKTLPYLFLSLSFIPLKLVFSYYLNFNNNIVIILFVFALIVYYIAILFFRKDDIVFGNYKKLRAKIISAK